MLGNTGESLAVTGSRNFTLLLSTSVILFGSLEIEVAGYQESCTKVCSWKDKILEQTPKCSHSGKLFPSLLALSYSVLIIGQREENVVKC